MPRMSFALLAALLAACGTGLENPGGPGTPSVDENRFPTGSDAELREAEGLAYEALFQLDRLDGVGDLWTERVEIDDLSTAHVKISQSVDGVPVLGGETIVHLKPNGTVSGVSDGLVRDVVVDAGLANYTDEEAIDEAVELTGGWDGVTNLPDARIMLFRHDEINHLVWVVQIERLDGTDRTSMPVVFMDAKSNEMVTMYDNLQTIDGSASTPYNGAITFPVTQSGSGYELRGDGIGTYTFNNTEPSWSSFNGSHLQQVSSPSTTFTVDNVAVDAHYGAAKTVEFLQEIHGRNGVNGSGGPTLKDGMITSGVHYGSRYSNAFWNGRAMVYGDGDGSRFSALTSLDIAAHEMGHGVTEFTAGLVYRNESGALNEAFSDIMGARVEAWVEGYNPNVWKLGEDCYTPFNGNNDALRYMNNPALDGSSREHYSTRYTGTSDNGGVHWNSGILNLAFYLTVEGGQHPNSQHAGVDVDGIGMAKAGAIYYRALSTYLTANSTFAQARTGLLSAAGDLYGTGSIEYASVGNAMHAVGVGAAIQPPGGPIDPPTPTVPPPTGEGNASNLSGAAGSWARYAVTVPAGATQLQVQIEGGTGDADLYLNAGTAPTDTVYVCRPYKSGNTEDCTIQNPTPGVYHIGVKAYSAFTAVNLLTTITGGTTPQDDSIDETGLAGAQGATLAYTIDVPAGARDLDFTMSGGTGDADMYVRFATAPTTTTYDCRPYKGGNAENCTFAAPQAGTYHVMLRGYQAFSGVSLRAQYAR